MGFASTTTTAKFHRAPFWTCCTTSVYMILLIVMSRAEETIFVTRKIKRAAAISFESISTHDMDLLYGRESSSTSDLDQICRRFPLWLGDMRQKCSAHTQWNPQRPSWWMDENEKTINDAILGNAMKAMEICLENDFLEYMKSWPDCKDEENQYSDICVTSPPEVTSYYEHKSEGDLVIIEGALSPQEAFVVQSLGRCIRKLLPLDVPFYEKRAFGQETDYLASGNACTFLAGFLQLFAPGVEAQIMNIASVAWLSELSGWGNDGDISFPDPRTLRIRTTEHLFYQTTSQLGVHTDNGSTYTILVSLSNPEDYGGGEFRLETNNVKFKPQKLTAVVFKSDDTFHAVESVTSGQRETFTTELWAYLDTPAGQPRPGLKQFKKYLKEQGYNTEEL